MADIGFHFPLAQNFWLTGQKIPPPPDPPKYWAETIPPSVRAPCPPPLNPPLHWTEAIRPLSATAPIAEWPLGAFLRGQYQRQCQQLDALRQHCPMYILTLQQGRSQDLVSGGAPISGGGPTPYFSPQTPNHKGPPLCTFRWTLGFDGWMHGFIATTFIQITETPSIGLWTLVGLSDLEEQNMVTETFSRRIYYTTFRAVQPGQELLVYYGGGYHWSLGFSVLPPQMLWYRSTFIRSLALQRRGRCRHIY